MRNTLQIQNLHKRPFKWIFITPKSKQKLPLIRSKHLVSFGYSNCRARNMPRTAKCGRCHIISLSSYHHASPPNSTPPPYTPPPTTHQSPPIHPPVPDSR